MSMNIAVLYIHGVHNHKPNYADWLHGEILDETDLVLPASSGFTPGQVFKAEVHWGDLFTPQVKVLDTSLFGDDTSWDWLRRFTGESVGQALAYQDPNSPMYAAVHQRVADALADLAEKAGPTARLIIVAHSLGSMIASNYIWDLQHGKPKVQIGPAPLGRMETLSGLVTMGSPLALDALRYPNLGMPPDIQGSVVPVKKTMWVNLYARADALGWPLRSLNHDYALQVDEDIAVRTTWWPWGATPASHLGYWKSSDVVQHVAQVMAFVWKRYRRQGD